MSDNISELYHGPCRHGICVSEVAIVKSGIRRIVARRVNGDLLPTERTSVIPKDPSDLHRLDGAAAIYSLIGTAKLNGLDPEAYLRYVITHISEHRITKVAELLPWCVSAKLPRLTQHTTETSVLGAWLSSSLKQSGCFEVFDREGLVEAKRSMELLGRKFEMPEVDLLISAAITSVSVTRRATQVLLVKSVTQSAELSFDSKAIDARTGSILSSGTFSVATPSSIYHQNLPQTMLLS